MPLRICFISSEVAPFAKTGGLADVSAALPRALAERGHEVRVFMPAYRRVRRHREQPVPVADLQDRSISLGGRELWFSISRLPLPDSSLEVELVRNSEFYERESIYSDESDEPLRFCLLGLAALEACRLQGWRPDIVHVNDWQGSLVPLQLRTRYANDPVLGDVRTVLTLHNLGYQGLFPADTIETLGLTEHRSLLYQEDLQDGVLNFLKTGLLYSNALTTVSRTYAQEIQTEDYGMGLEGLLQKRSDSLFGIVNGIDEDEWNPAGDSFLDYPFGPRELDYKTRNRDALLAELRLAPNPAGPVFGIVSRLAEQKGFELFPEVLPVLLEQADVRLVVLGSGAEKYVQYFQWLVERYPGRVAFSSDYDERMAHRIEAGIDIFLMPSRYEPCGLNQMYSQRYGTLPLVRRTGGLADTVEPVDLEAETGNGFMFDDFTSDALLDAVRESLIAFRERRVWRKLVRTAMTRDFSWRRRAGEYEQLYHRLVPHAAERAADPSTSG